MKEHRFTILILPILTLVLEIIPYGAVCNFARPATDGSIGHFRELYSYFDLLPFGYANFAPFITGISTCVLLVMLAVYVITGRGRVLTASRKLLFACVILSACPILLGFHFLSVVGVLITLLLLAEYFLLRYAEKCEHSN